MQAVAASATLKPQITSACSWMARQAAAKPGASTVVRHVSDSERRARLARRHCLCADHFATSVETAVRAMTALHATEAATVYLSLQARVPHLTQTDIEGALYEQKTVVKQLAMRRTLFAIERDLLPAVWGSAAARVAAQQRAKLIKDIETSKLAVDGERHLNVAAAGVEASLNDVTRPAQQVREMVPEVQGELAGGPASDPWSMRQPLCSRLLTVLGADARLMRATNDGHWRTNKPLWTRTSHWLGGEPPAALPAAAGWAELVRR